MSRHARLRQEAQALRLAPHRGLRGPAHDQPPGGLRGRGREQEEQEGEETEGGQQTSTSARRTRR